MDGEPSWQWLGKHGENEGEPWCIRSGSWACEVNFVCTGSSCTTMCTFMLKKDLVLLCRFQQKDTWMPNSELIWFPAVGKQWAAVFVYKDRWGRVCIFSNMCCFFVQPPLSQPRRGFQEHRTTASVEARVVKSKGKSFGLNLPPCWHRFSKIGLDLSVFNKRAPGRSDFVVEVQWAYAGLPQLLFCSVSFH